MIFQTSRSQKQLSLFFQALAFCYSRKRSIKEEEDNQKNTLKSRLILHLRQPFGLLHLA